MFNYESRKRPYEIPGDSVVRVRVVVGVNAGVILALGLAFLVPLVLSWLYRDGFGRSFLSPAAVMIPLGAAGVRASRAEEVNGSNPLAPTSGHGPVATSSRPIFHWCPRLSYSVWRSAPSVG
jgi:hypothetical protein